MNEPDGIDALIDVAGAVHDGTDVSADLFTSAGVGARLRLVVAATALAAAGRPVNKSTIVEAAQVARSATYRNHADLLEAARTVLPSLVTAMLGDRASPDDLHALREQLALAHASIERERQRRREVEEELDQARTYAMELHRRLKPEYDAAMRERETKVRTLRPVPNAPGKPPAPKPRGKRT